MTLQDLKALLKFHRNNAARLNDSDLDELVLSANSLHGTLPDRFFAILNQFEASTNRDEAEDNFLDRLLKVVEVTESMSTEQEKSYAPSELLPSFELTEDDKKRVLELCAQIRKIVLATEVFDQPHRRRLLNRVAAIENEVEKEKGQFDVILGGINDFGETLGKFGVDIKPLTDRISEIRGITQKRTAAYEQIPAKDELKGLPGPESEDKPEGEE